MIDFILGEYSVADIAAYPWVIDHGRQAQDLDDFPNLRRWFEAVSARPVVQRARLLADTINTAPDARENSRAILFGQGAGRSGRHAS